MNIKAVKIRQKLDKMKESSTIALIKSLKLMKNSLYRIHLDNHVEDSDRILNNTY